MAKVDERTPEQKLDDLQHEFEIFRDDAEAKQEKLVQSMMGVLNMYLALGDNTIKVLLGKNVTAEVKFHGPISQEAISDLLAHLAFYKKYFPKNEADPDCLTADKLIHQFREILADDRAEKAH